MAHRLCKCGHRKYKHKDEYNGYPIDAPACDGENLPKYHIDGCRCLQYEPQSNLEYLEALVDKNIRSKKV